MTSNRSALRALFDGFWKYLTEHPEFAPLGCKLFSPLEGRPLPVAADGSIASTDLPAFTIENVQNLSGDEPRDDAARQRTLRFRVNCLFVFPSLGLSDQSAGFFSAAEALVVAEDILTSESARLGGLAGSPGVDDYAVESGDVESIPSVANPRLIMFCVSRFSVVIEKRLTNPT